MSIVDDDCDLEAKIIGVALTGVENILVKDENAGY